VAPPQGTPGRDHVQRVHLLHAAAHEEVAREWLAGFADRDVNPWEITTALIELAQGYPGVTFTVRIHRFPGDAGVILILQVDVQTDGSAGDVHTLVACEGTPHCRGSSRISSKGAMAEDFLGNDVEVAWNHAPTQIEEYVFQIRDGSVARAEDRRVGWMAIAIAIAIAGAIAVARATRRSAA
jgi:hypothetical protein